ncbi:MAG TPA: DUF6117 family protein [Methanoregulaceae archaeon]|jgi:hypothetical protein|nr:DUF6117 family protein [Methanoregulaceae archaeon]HQN17577.1 DUF6117 family protein [Syntrophobacteraceae bacterium]
MIAKGYKTNFETLKRAVKNNDACIVECRDKETGKPVIALCAVSIDPKTREHILAPLAKLFDGNPYEELIPPTA